jgi:phage shock protein C
MEPKKLYKSRNDRYIDGVCGGIAAYFNIDSTLVRIGLIIFCLMGGSGVIAYIIAMCIIPKEPVPNMYQYEENQYDNHSNGPRI